MGDAPENPAIEIRDVWTSYTQDEVYVLRGVSLPIPANSFVALTGSSGSGKTTLLKLINRLTEPVRGQVLVQGGDVAVCDPVLLRRGIGYAFQGVGLFPHLTVAAFAAIVVAIANSAIPIAHTSNIFFTSLLLIRNTPNIC